MYCCIIGVSFSVGLFLTAAALISFGTVVIGSVGDAISLVLRRRKASTGNPSFYHFGCATGEIAPPPDRSTLD
jgi:hypothetical protein